MKWAEVRIGRGSGGLGVVLIFGLGGSSINFDPFGFGRYNSQGPFCIILKVGGPDLTSFQNTSQG